MPSSAAGNPAISIEDFVERFAAGWRTPHPHAWDDLVSDDLVLRQPLLPTRRGRDALAEEYGRLLQLVPDLNGHVIRWTTASKPDEELAGVDAVVDIHLQLQGTVGGQPLKLPLIDVCTLRGGLLSERTSYFDPTPVIAAMARTPAVWPRWWRSGVGPAVGRRRLLERRTAPSIPEALAIGRLVLGVPAWAAPGLANRVYGFDAPLGASTRYLTSLYGARAAALAVGTLLAPEGTDERRRWQRIGLAVDVVDTVAGLRIDLAPRARWTSVAITGGYAAAGFISLTRRQNPENAGKSGRASVSADRDPRR